MNATKRRWGCFALLFAFGVGLQIAYYSGRASYRIPISNQGKKSVSIREMSLSLGPPSDWWVELPGGDIPAEGRAKLVMFYGRAGAGGRPYRIGAFTGAAAEEPYATIDLTEKELLALEEGRARLVATDRCIKYQARR